MRNAGDVPEGETTITYAVPGWGGEIGIRRTRGVKARRIAEGELRNY